MEVSNRMASPVFLANSFLVTFGSLNFQSPSISSWIFYFSSAFSFIRSLAYTLLFLCLWNSLHPVLRRSLHLFLCMILPFDSFTSYLLFKVPQHASFSFSFCVQAHMCWLMFHEIRRETPTFFAQFFFTIVATTIVWTQFLLDKRWKASICHWMRPQVLSSFFVTQLRLLLYGEIIPETKSDFTNYHLQRLVVLSMPCNVHRCIRHKCGTWSLLNGVVISCYFSIHFLSSLQRRNAIDKFQELPY